MRGLCRLIGTIEDEQPGNHKSAVAAIVVPLGLDAAAYLGFGEDTVWFSLGSDVLGDLKGHIDAQADGQPQAVPPAFMKLSLLPFMQAAARLSPEAGQAAEVLTPTSDAFEIISRATPEGAASTRISVQEGLIKLIGVAAQAAGAGGNQPAFDDVDF